MKLCRYYCILCKFVIHTTEPWVVPVMECPSCHVKVETRELKDEDEDKKPQVPGITGSTIFN